VFQHNPKFTELLDEVLRQKDSGLVDKLGDKFIEFILTSRSREAVSLSSPQPYNIAVDEGGTAFYSGYPDCNLLKQISAVCTTWAVQEIFPVTFLKCQGFSDTTAVEIERLCGLTELVREIFAKIDSEDFGLAMTLIKDLLLALEFRGMATIFGIRTTTGSIDEPWPSLVQVKEAFEKPHTTYVAPEKLKRGHKPSKLTVGARALAKHSHRSSEGFWGTSKGSEDFKNKQAAGIIERILKNCVWINVHTLPHAEYVIEIRVEAGYGARWTLSGEFRGFLEPQMEGGHEKGWKH
jgi:hypothetical protein